MKLRVMGARVLAKTSTGIALSVRVSLIEVPITKSFGEAEEMFRKISAFRVDSVTCIGIYEEGCTLDAVVFIPSEALLSTAATEEKDGKAAAEPAETSGD